MPSAPFLPAKGTACARKSGLQHTPHRLAQIMPAMALPSLSCKACSSAHRRLACPLARTAFEILQVLPHLLEGKPQSEEAFGKLCIEVAGEALPAQIVDQGRIGVERGLDPLAWRWATPAAKRVSDGADVVGNRGRSVLDGDFEALLESFRRWQLCGSADHHQVVTEPQERSHQRRRVRIRGEACGAL